MYQPRKQFMVLKDCEMNFPFGIENRVYFYKKNEIISLRPNFARTLKYVELGYIKQL